MTSKDPTGLRTVIVDDEPLGRDVVRHMLQSHPDIVVVGEAANGVKALEEIRAQQPQLVFLDIKMPKLGGLEVLKTLSSDSGALPVVIFTTAYDEYAVQAFERNALDYLLKPFDQERFNEALARARRHVRTAHEADFGRRLRDLIASNSFGALDSTPKPRHDRPPERVLSRFTLKEGGRVTFVSVDAVDWFEASGNYVGLHVQGKTHLIHETLSDVEQSLDPTRFLRIHRSTIVQVDRIKELQPFTNGEFVVILHDGTRLKLSRSFRERADEVLGIR
jgi:two-component system, LytTR family, response regulator